jgi:hypothetical protein
VHSLRERPVPATTRQYCTTLINKEMRTRSETDCGDGLAIIQLDQRSSHGACSEMGNIATATESRSQHSVTPHDVHRLRDSGPDPAGRRCARLSQSSSSTMVDHALRMRRCRLNQACEFRNRFAGCLATSGHTTRKVQLQQILYPYTPQ